MEQISGRQIVLRVLQRWGDDGTVSVLQFPYLTIRSRSYASCRAYIHVGTCTLRHLSRTPKGNLSFLRPSPSRSWNIVPCKPSIMLLPLNKVKPFRTFKFASRWLPNFLCGPRHACPGAHQPVFRHASLRRSWRKWSCLHAMFLCISIGSLHPRRGVVTLRQCDARDVKQHRTKTHEPVSYQRTTPLSSLASEIPRGGRDGKKSGAPEKTIGKLRCPNFTFPTYLVQ
jgi:hypothetical protein